jgi:hypothetical protein
MSLHTKSFGKLPDNSGVTASVMNYGATLYAYKTDDTLQQVSYSNAVVSTPSVSYTYDTKL